MKRILSVFLFCLLLAAPIEAGGRKKQQRHRLRLRVRQQTVRPYIPPAVRPDVIEVLPNSFTVGDRRQLLAGFSDAVLLNELDRRLLSLYTIEELQLEARRRKLRD